MKLEQTMLQMIERMLAIADEIKANQELRLKRMLAKQEAFMKEVREEIKCNKPRKGPI
jgi:hypothetical protein